MSAILTKVAIRIWCAMPTQWFKELWGHNHRSPSHSGAKSNSKNHGGGHA